MRNNTIDYIAEYLDDLSSDNLIRQTEAAFHLNSECLDYQSLINLLNSDNINLKTYALLKLDEIKTIKDAKILVSCLNNKDSRIRELSSGLISNLFVQEKYWYIFEEFLDNLTESLTDPSPKVCRNVTNSLSFINNKLAVIEKLIKIINDNFNTFTLYWSLYALESVLSTVSVEKKPIFNDIINIVIKTSLCKEYQVREKSASIVNILNKRAEDQRLDKLIRQLSNDENFYVRNALSSRRNNENIHY